MDFQRVIIKCFAVGIVFGLIHAVALYSPELSKWFLDSDDFVGCHMPFTGAALHPDSEYSSTTVLMDHILHPKEFSQSSISQSKFPCEKEVCLIGLCTSNHEGIFYTRKYIKNYATLDNIILMK